MLNEPLFKFILAIDTLLVFVLMLTYHYFT